MSFVDGPYIQAAVFCNDVIQEKSGPLSLIRIVDTVIHTAQGPNPPEELQPFVYQFYLVVMLKAGRALGRSNLRIIPSLPDGTQEKSLEFTVHFESGEKGHNIIANMTYQFKQEGLYWFDVDLEGEKLTSMPLRVKYNRIVTA